MLKNPSCNSKQDKMDGLNSKQDKMDGLNSKQQTLSSSIVF
jgi:hypothetical protein